MKIVIATHLEYDAIYVDGIKYMEDQILYACDLFTALESRLPCMIGKEDIEVKSVDEVWWDSSDLDCYPDRIEDVVFERHLPMNIVQEIQKLKDEIVKQDEVIEQLRSQSNRPSSWDNVDPKYRHLNGK